MLLIRKLPCRAEPNVPLHRRNMLACPRDPSIVFRHSNSSLLVPLRLYGSCEQIWRARDLVRNHCSGVGSASDGASEEGAEMLHLE